MSERFKSYVLVHSATILYGFTGIIGKVIELDALGLVWIRLILAVSSLYIYIKLTKRSFKLNSKKDLIQMIITGFLLGLHWLTFFHSLKVSNVTIALITLSTFPLFTSLLEPIFYKRSVRVLDISIGLLILFGTFICFPNFSLSSENTEGILTGILSAALISAVWVSSHSLTKKYSGFTSALHQLFYAMILLTLLNVHRLSLITTISSSDWIYLAILGVLCTAITTVFSYTSMRVLSAYASSIVINLEPVYGILLAFFFFPDTETMTSNIYFGATIILCAAFIEPMFSKRK